MKGDNCVSRTWGNHDIDGKVEQLQTKAKQNKAWNVSIIFVLD